jgi:molybdopterin converting factor small subunit
MTVSVNFYGLQRKLTCSEEMKIPLNKKTRVGDVLHHVKECYPDLPLSEDVVLVTVNNQVTSLDQILKTDDQISFIPHIGGG